MSELALLGRLVLAGVFGLAALAKLLDVAGARRALRAFGIPASAVRPAATALPLVELAVALGVLLAATTLWAAGLGALLLAIFTGAVAYNLARGRRPDCHCFGSLSAGPIGLLTLVRNGAFLAVAGFVLWQGPDATGLGLDLWIADLIAGGHLGAVATTGMGIVLLAVALALGLATKNPALLRALGALAARLGAERPGLPVGSPAPEFRLAGLNRKRVALQDLRSAGKPVLLTFISPDCPGCHELLPDLGRWQGTLAGQLTIALVTHGDREVHRTNAEIYGLRHILFQEDYEAAKAYRIPGTPSAVVVNPDGTVGSAVAEDRKGIQSLVQTATGRHLEGSQRPTAAQFGEPAPPVHLRALNRQWVDLEGLRGQTTAILFWNPGCVHSQRLLSAVRDYEASPPPDAPNLLIVSRGSWQANRKLGFRSTVALDPSLRVCAAFGVKGTPSAVLVAADGVIASGVARGVRAVQALLGIPLESRVVSIPLKDIGERIGARRLRRDD